MALMRRIGGLLSTLAALAVVADESAAGDRFIARTTPQGSGAALAAYRGLLVWDTFAAVYSWRGGKRRTVVRSPTSMFLDIDLGPTRRGRGTRAVVQRCPYSQFVLGKCDVNSLDLQNGRLRPVRGASSKTYDERSPGVWKDNVAFVRAAPQVSPPAAPPSVAPLMMTSPRVRLARFRNRPCPLTPHPADLAGRTVAYCTEEQSGDARSTAIVVKRFDKRGRGRQCVVARDLHPGIGHEGPYALLESAHLDSGYVYWARWSADLGSMAFAIHRRRLPTPRCRPRGKEQWIPVPTVGSGPALTSFAVDRGTVFYATYDAIYKSRSAFTNR